VPGSTHNSLGFNIPLHKYTTACQEGSPVNCLAKVIQAFDYNFLITIPREMNLSVHFIKAALFTNTISLFRINKIWLKA
jgi:hypothetical protein